MNLQKEIFNNVDGFRELEEDKKEKFIYLFKHRYIVDLVVNRKLVLLFMLINVVFLIFSIIGLFLKNNIAIKIICSIFIVFATIYTIILLLSMFRKSRKFLEAEMSKINLLNNKVISQDMWKKVKKYDRWEYRYFRTEQCYGKCYDTTRDLANILKEPEIKILWVGATHPLTGHKFGHAILRKGEYIYDSNLRRTYESKKYLEAFDAQIFKEFSIGEKNKYLESDAYEINWREFGIWCKERGILRATRDRLQEKNQD